MRNKQIVMTALLCGTTLSLSTGARADGTVECNIDPMLGSSTLECGVSSDAGALGGTAIGTGAHAYGLGSTATGADAAATGSFSTAVGDAATATGANSTALGAIADASGDDSTAVGRDSP